MVKFSHVLSWDIIISPFVCVYVYVCTCVFACVSVCCGSLSHPVEPGSDGTLGVCVCVEEMKGMG